MLFEGLDMDIKFEYVNISQLNLSNILHQINILQHTASFTIDIIAVPLYA